MAFDFKGKTVLVTGASGSGMTLLLRMAIGLEQPDSGEVFVGGQELDLLRESELSFIGHLTEQALAELRADKVFIGARAVSLQNNNSENSSAAGTEKLSGKAERETTGTTALSANSFIKEAAEGNNSEIAMAEIAQRKAQNSQVKQYAEMLLRDHKKANDELKPIAQAHGVFGGRAALILAVSDPGYR